MLVIIGLYAYRVSVFQRHFPSLRKIYHSFCIVTGLTVMFCIKTIITIGKTIGSLWSACSTHVANKLFMKKQPSIAFGKYNYTWCI